MQIDLCVLACVGGYFWDFTFFTSHVSARTSVSILWSVSHYQHFTWKKNIHCCMIPGFQEMYPMKLHTFPPNTLPIYGMYRLCSNSQYTNRHNNTLSGCIWDSFGGSFLKFLSWTQRTFRIQTVEYAEIVVWLYWFCTISNSVFSFFLNCVIKFPHASVQ